MHRSIFCGRFLITLLGLLFIAGTGQAGAQGKPEKAVIAVFDLQGVRTEPTTPIAASDRLREELLNTGHFKLLSRNTLDKKLADQGLNQLTCMERDCALKVGQVLGARLVLTGKIIIIDSGAWQVSAEITDVATGETIVAGSIIHQGNIVGLISKGIPQLKDKLIPAGDSSGYDDIVDFLLQKKSAPPTSADSIASERMDEQAGQKPPPGKTPMELSGYRIWGSPFASFSLDFRDSDFNELETFEGSGTSLGFEVQTNKVLAFGAAIHVGSLDTVDSPISGSGERPISGDYQVINLLVMGAVPRARPWFYFGSGLGYTTVDWNDGAVSGSDSVTSILGMLRFAYTFDSGLMLGFDFQASLIESSKGDRHDLLQSQGAVGTEASPAVGSLFLGYAF